MSKSREIPWVIEEHTKIKHQLLNDYLGAWMSIMYAQQKRSGNQKKLIYIDGFAGPGEYWADEFKKSKVNGSPVIVAEKANTYIDADPTRKFLIIAIDNNNLCVDHLKPILDRLNKHKQQWLTYSQNFETSMDILFGYLDKENARIAPAFFFIDPFGYSGFTMDTLARILCHPRTELFINFMHYDINRFLETDHSQEHLKKLFGSDEYKKCQSLNSDQKTTCLMNLYCAQLRAIAKVPYVLPFRMNTPGQGIRPRYFLIHASQHIKALKEMKNRMARLSSQAFKFEAIGLSKEKQFGLFEPSDENRLKEQILSFIQNKNDQKILYDDIENWAYEYTAGIDKDIKLALLELEKEKKLIISRQPRQKTSTVVSGALIHLK